MRSASMSLVMAVLLSSPGWAETQQDTPEKTYLLWHKAMSGPIGSKDRFALAECYSDEAFKKKRDFAQMQVFNYIKDHKFEFAEGKITGDAAEVVLKNDAGKTLVFEMRKEYGRWLINRLPDVRPFYMRLLSVKIIIPVCIVVLILALLQRRRELRAL